MLTRQYLKLQMEQLEIKYRDEIKKNGGLLRMNEELMKRSDFLNEFIGGIAELFTNKKFKEEHEFDEEELLKLKKLITEQWKGKLEECNQFKLEL
jgi:hypothetical protein